MWDLDESVRYYKNSGAPSDQTALVAFLRELQDEGGGRILPGMLSEAAEKMGVRESYLLAVVKRFPSLRRMAGLRISQPRILIPIIFPRFFWGKS